MSLVLRHAGKRVSGTWGPDDYDVINGSGGVVGRILKPQAAATSNTPWEWAITGCAVVPIVPSCGSRRARTRQRPRSPRRGDRGAHERAGTKIIGRCTGDPHRRSSPGRAFSSPQLLRANPILVHTAPYGDH